MKKIASIFLATVIAVMSFNFCITAVTQTADAVDLTQSLIYNIKPNSWTINENDYQHRIVGGQFSFFTDGAKKSTDLTDGDYGKFLASDGSFKNTDDNLTVYHDIVFPLDEKTGTSVQVQQFFLSAASDGSNETWKQFEVYFALELNHLTDAESRFISYTNTEKKADILINLVTPVKANYMLVRCINGVHEGADPNNSYPRISEIACFGNDAVNPGFTVSNALPDGKSLSDSVIYNSDYVVVDNKHGTGNNTVYNSWKIPSWRGLTDGDSSANTGIDQPRFYPDGALSDERSVPNLGNKLELTADYVLQLTDKDGVSQKVNGVYVACAPGTSNNLTLWRYQIYISDSLENLTSTESLAVSFCNKDLTKTQYFAFDKPISGAYIMLRISSAIPLRGHGRDSWASPTWESSPKLSEFAVFGTDTDEYTFSSTSPTNLTESVIYNTETEHSLVQVGLAGDQDSAMPAYAITGTFAKLTDGTLDNTFEWGYVNENSSCRYHSFDTIHNATGYLETYEDYIFDLNQKNNGPVDISSVFVNGSVYKLEIYASHSRNDIDNPENLVATVASDDSNKYIELNTPVTAGYLLVRSIFCKNYTSAPGNYARTHLGEVAVFGTKNTAYTVEPNVNSTDELKHSYIAREHLEKAYFHSTDGNVYDWSAASVFKNFTDSDTTTSVELKQTDGDIFVLEANKRRNNCKADLDLYFDAVYKLGDNPVPIKEVLVATGNEAATKTMSAYSYDIFVADTLEELGKETSVKATVVNPSKSSVNLVTFNETVSGKYIMVRITMGTQFDCYDWGTNLSYIRFGEVAVFGPETVLDGNVNGDNGVDICDLVLYKKHLVDNIPVAEKRALDVEFDNVIDSKDLAALRRILLK